MQNHCLKSVQIWSFFWSVFSDIRTEYREIRTRKNFVFGHFSRTEPAHDLLIPAVCQKASLFRDSWLHMAIQSFDDLAKIPGKTFFREIPILRSFAKYSWNIFFYLGKDKMFFSENWTKFCVLTIYPSIFEWIGSTVLYTLHCNRKWSFPLRSSLVDVMKSKKTRTYQKNLSRKSSFFLYSMYVYVYMCTYVYVYIHTYVYIYIYIYTDTTDTYIVYILNMFNINK